MTGADDKDPSRMGGGCTVKAMELVFPLGLWATSALPEDTGVSFARPFRKLSGERGMAKAER
jgi:hypothetical protein